MGWGWCLSDEVGTRTVDLVLCFTDGTEQTVACLSDRARDDVARAFPAIPHSVEAGFVFLAKLASKSEIKDAVLNIAFKNGEHERRSLPGFPEKFSPTFVAPQFTVERIKVFWRLLASGRIIYLLKRTVAILRQFRMRVVSRQSEAIVARGESALIFDHDLGGGANKYRKEKIAQILETGKSVKVVTFHLAHLLYRVDTQISGQVGQKSFGGFAELCAHLLQSRYAAIHVNNLVSYPDPAAVLELIKAILRQSPCPVFTHLHDYHYVCPSYSLINSKGRYCGIPDADTCRSCLKTNNAVFPSFVRINEIAPWRETWSELLRISTNVIAFSQSTIDIFTRAFPADGWRDKVLLQPHSVDLLRFPRINAKFEDPLKIAIIGNINFAKGSEIVHDALALIVRDQLPLHVVVIGTLERYSATPALTVTGPFENSALPSLLVKHGIGVCWLPSICPETFSYVTEEVITMGLPMVCFDLGAPAARIKRYPHGAVAVAMNARCALDAIATLAKKVAAEQHA